MRKPLNYGRDTELKRIKDSVGGSEVVRSRSCRRKFAAVGRIEAGQWVVAKKRDNIQMAGICNEDVSFPLYAPRTRESFQRRDTRFQATASPATISNRDEPRLSMPNVRTEVRRELLELHARSFLSHSAFVPRHGTRFKEARQPGHSSRDLSCP